MGERTTTLRIRKPSEPAKAKSPPLYESIMKGNGLSMSQAMLIAASIRESCEDPVKRFRELDPGLRELRMQNAISAIWKGYPTSAGLTHEETLCNKYSRFPGLAVEIAIAEQAYSDLQERFELRPPTEEQKLQAVGKTHELSIAQLGFLDRFRDVRMKSAIIPETVREVRRWLRDLPSDRMQWAWENDRYSLPVLATLVHKIKYTLAAPMEKEADFINHFFGNTNPKTLDSIKEAFSKAPPFHGRDPYSHIKSAVWDAWRDPLYEAAQATRELEVLFRMLDVDVIPVESTLKDRGRTVPAHVNMASASMENQDAMTSLMIRFGKHEVELDAVFDGVGGHKGGRIASAIARETLEVAAVSGWITTPEHVRRALVLADIIINMEKSPKDLRFMSTTAVVTFLRGQLFWGIHCGDSDWKLLKSGKVYSSIPHTDGEFLTSSLGYAPGIMINNQMSGHRAIMAGPGDIYYLWTDGVGDVLCDHELPLILDPCTVRTEQKMQSDLLLLISDRDNPKKTYELLCSCPDIPGKTDDRTEIIRIVK